MWTVAVTSTTYPFTRVTVRCSGEGRDEFFYNFDFYGIYLTCFDSQEKSLLYFVVVEVGPVGDRSGFS